MADALLVIRLDAIQVPVGDSRSRSSSSRPGVAR